MEEKNLTDAQLEEVSGGATTKTKYTFYCPTCGSKLRSTMAINSCAEYRCDKCGVSVAYAKAVKRVTTTTIDGDMHSVSGEF